MDATVSNQILTFNTGLVNVTGDLTVGGNITTGDRFYLPNGGSIGDNSTCAFIFYDANDLIIETKGCV